MQCWWKFGIETDYTFKTGHRYLQFVLKNNECFLKFGVEVGVEESIVNAPPDHEYNSDQLVKSNLTFCAFLICSLKNQYF
jgi:hypothetical protein